MVYAEALQPMEMAGQNLRRHPASTTREDFHLMNAGSFSPNGCTGREIWYNNTATK